MRMHQPTKRPEFFSTQRAGVKTHLVPGFRRGTEPAMRTKFDFDRQPQIAVKLPLFNLLSGKAMPDSFSRIQGNIFHLLKVREPAGHHRGDLFSSAVAFGGGSMLQSRVSSAFLRLAISEKICPSRSTISSKGQPEPPVAALSRFQKARKPGNGHSP